MKADIHPKFNTAAEVICSCGATYKVGSIKDTINVEICSACHPFYTGADKVIDTAGRVEKFKAKRAAVKAPKAAKKAE